MKTLPLMLVGGFAMTWTILPAQDNHRKVVPVISSTKNTEFAPTISADGRTMIYESDVDKRKGWELFEAHLVNDSTWSTPVPLKAINEKCQFLAGPSLSYDGNTLYFTAFIEGQTKTEDIYYSDRLTGDNWTEPKSVGAPINTEEGYEGFPSISANGNSLYFIRVNEENEYDKKNKENCFTIYVSHRTHEGKWGEPERLPPNINYGCERDPKIMADNHTLIFSSIREGGKGKFDLMQSRMRRDFTWSDPVSLDFINAEDNDQSPCISASGDVMFFYTQKDIYQVRIPEQYRQEINVTVQGTVKSATSQKPLRAAVHVKGEDASDSAEFFLESSSVDGHYSLVLGAGKKYHVYFSHSDHIAEYVELDFSNRASYLEVRKDIALLTEYTLRLTVEDADLKTPMKAWMNVDGPGKPFSDTARVERYPISLTLPAGKDYQIKTAANNFPEMTTPWKFDAVTFKREMTYTIPLLHEKITYTVDVTHVTTGQKTKLKVYFKNENTGEVIVADAGDPVELRKGDRYEVMTSSEKGYFFSTATVIAGETGHTELDLIIIPIEVGSQLTLDYITFASNSAALNKSSNLELDRVIEFLQKNPTVEIEISAHTDDVGNSDYNVKLSQRRAQSAVKYLTQKGIAKSKLKAKGFGKDQPAVPNDSEENRAKNRRVELRILKIG